MSSSFTNERLVNSNYSGDGAASSTSKSQQEFDRLSIHKSTSSSKQNALRDLSYLLVSPELTRDNYSASRGYGSGSGGKVFLRSSGYSFTQEPARVSSSSDSSFSSSSAAATAASSSSSLLFRGGVAYNSTNEVHASLYSPRSEYRNPYDVRADPVHSFDFDEINEGDKVSAYGTATDIISAFREMHDKVAAVERERKDAIRMRDELKANCVADRQFLINSVNQKDIQMTSTLLTMKASNDQLRVFKDDLDLKLSCKEDINRSLQRNMNANKTIHTGLEEDLLKLRGTISFMEDRNFRVQETLTTSNVLANKAEVQLQELPKAFSIQYNGTIKKIKNIESEITDAKNREKRAIEKTKALVKYIDLVYQMNNDLVSTLIAREESKERIIQLAGKFTPPRYSWPKRISNPNIQKVFDVVSDAAVASALEQSAERAAHVVSSHIKEINRTFAHSPNPKVSPYKAASNHASPTKQQQRNSDRFSINDLLGSSRRNNNDNHIRPGSCSSNSNSNSNSSNSFAYSDLDSIIHNLSDSDVSTDVSLSDLKKMYIAKERSRKFNEYVKARLMKKKAKNNKFLKAANKREKTKRKSSRKIVRKSININIIDDGLASKLVNADYVKSYSRPLSSSTSARATTRLSKSGSEASLRGITMGSSMGSMGRARSMNLSPGKLLERHAAQTLASATTAYIMKERDSQSSRARADNSDNNDLSRFSRVSLRSDSALISSRGKGAFLPTSGNYSKEHNVKAKLQSDDRARIFRHQALISHDK